MYDEFHTRRRLLRLCGVATLGGVAGCSSGGGDSDGSGGSSPTDEVATPTTTPTATTTSTPTQTEAETDLSPPPEDADPKNLLPEPKGDWKLTQTNPEPSGEAGISGVYELPGGDGYQVAVFRWASNSKAKSKKDTYESYMAKAYVVLGNFSFVVYGSAPADMYTLLGYSSALTKEYAKNNDMIA